VIGVQALAAVVALGAGAWSGAAAPPPPRPAGTLAAQASRAPDPGPAPDAARAPTAQGGAPTDSAVEERNRAIATGLRCVVCQGLSIEDSPAELAREMRAIVREQVAAGRSRAEIEAYFVERYGEFVLLQPRAEGFNLVVYALPVAALLLGGLFVAAFVRRWSGPEEAGGSEGDRHGDEEEG
jgi:cytochrome c-type biogenesis protein CcmH